LALARPLALRTLVMLN